MPDLTPQDIEAKLLAAGFERSGPVVEALSDPIVDTPMVVTLDQLRPYELDPRVTRNPRFDEIKASIRERGLDTPPAITRRPGAPAYIIRNGTLPPEYEVSAWTDHDEIMGVRHVSYALEGVQYHPESFLTLEGTKLLKNFVER